MLFTTFPPLAGAENRLLSYRLALRRVNSRAFYAELSGDMRISALKVRVLCSAPSRQEGEEAREVKYWVAGALGGGLLSRINPDG